MGRIRYNGLTATLGAALTNSATSITFAAALTHSGGTNVPTLSGDYIPLSILEADGTLAEIVWLTAYTSGATTGTIERGKEGTAGVAHDSGADVVHAPTVDDIEDEAGNGGTYTPTLYGETTNPTLGSGAVADGRYRKTGSWVHGWAAFTFGTSGAATGTGMYSVSLPVNFRDASGGSVALHRVIGQFEIVDASGSVTKFGQLVRRNATGNLNRAYMQTFESQVVDHAAPWAWAASDRIRVSFSYETE